MKRFWNKVEKLENGCWEWTASLNNQGYGRFRLNGKARLAHRVSAEWHGIDCSQIIRHKCDNPKCVNPQHLIAGSLKDNMQDCVKRDRICKGSNSYNSKLTEEDIPTIRKRIESGESQTSIAKDYGVDQTVISRIKRNKYWKHVK